MQSELKELKEAGISVFSVAVSNRAEVTEVRGISTVPQVANINYFISPSITNLDTLSNPLATQVFFVHFSHSTCLSHSLKLSIRAFIHQSSRRNKKSMNDR